MELWNVQREKIQAYERTIAEERCVNTYIIVDYYKLCSVFCLYQFAGLCKGKLIHLYKQTYIDK